VRALIDYRPALRERTGIGEYTHELVRALAGRIAPSDLDISVFSSSFKDRLELRDAGFERVRRVDRRWPVRTLNAAWHRLEWPSVEVLTGLDFDVVQSMTPLLVPTRRAAQVITIADLSFLSDPSWTRAEVRRDYPSLVHSHARRADAIVVMSRYVAGEVQRLLQIDANRIAVVEPGAPSWTPRSTAPTHGYVLFVGTLEPRKNVGVLLDAFERLLTRTRVELVMAGKSTPAAASWLERTQKPPLAGRVRHLGYVDADQRRELYAGASVLVLPSFDEGFGLPVLEAMTLGVPVIVSNRGSLPEVVGNAGAIVEPSEPQALADAIERVIGDEAYASACVSKGLTRSRGYRWDRAAELTYAVYQQAVANRCASA
jgi:glycosyltransferase involved in cell wall biosynthesis